MTKASFIRYCETSTMPPRVTVRGIYRERESAVFLTGLWANGAVVDVQLYQPTPGRQWEHRHTRDASLKKAEAKFQRWLDEWQSNK